MHGSPPRFGLTGTLATGPNGKPELTSWLPPEDCHREAHALAAKHLVTVTIIVDGVRATFEPNLIGAK